MLKHSNMFYCLALRLKFGRHSGTLNSCVALTLCSWFAQINRFILEVTPTSDLREFVAFD